MHNTGVCFLRLVIKVEGGSGSWLLSSTPVPTTVILSSLNKTHITKAQGAFFRYLDMWIGTTYYFPALHKIMIYFG